MQAFFVLASGVMGYAMVGTDVVGPLVVLGWLGALVLIVVAGLYYWRRGRAPQAPMRERWADFQVGAWAVATLALAPTGLLFLDGAVSLDGIAFPGDVAAVWAFSGVVACCVAIYVSSLADWFYVLPAVCGFFDGKPAWIVEGGRSASERRTTAKLWVVHRALAEIVGSIGVALTIAIAVVAVGGLVSSDATLSMAIESLGATAIAVGLLGLFGPRVRDAVLYMLSESAGIGEWAEVRGADGRLVNSGVVVDVSIDPGVKLIDGLGSRLFVPLRQRNLVQAAPITRPPECDGAWAYEQFEHIREACRIEAAQPTPDRSDDVADGDLLSDGAAA